MNKLPHNPLADLSEEDYRLGHLSHFSEKPVTLPTADPKEIFNEFEQLRQMGNHRPTPKEL